MPRFDHVVLRYTATEREGSGAGSTYEFELQEEAGLWCEVVQVTTPTTTLGGATTFSTDSLYKVRMQTPDDEYDLENTRFVWEWKGRIHYMQPWKSEVRSGTRSERCIYYCKGVRPFLA